MTALRISLPDRIDAADAREAIKRVTESLRHFPLARFVVGSVAVDRGKVLVDAAGCDFDVLHWVALADSCLEWAAKRLAADGDRELLLCVERARAELDFEERQDA